MSLNTLVHELVRFIKDNLWRLILGMILGVIVAVSARYFISELLLKEKSEAYDYLSTVYAQEPAEFQAVITMEDGDVFPSSNIYDDYFSSPQMIKKVEDKTGIAFGRWFEDEQTLDLKKNGNFRGGIAAIRDSSSGLITFRFLVAPTSKENLAISRAYEEIITSEDIHFNQAHAIEITRPSETIELLDLDEVTTVPTGATLNMFDGLSTKNLIIYTVIGSFVGGVLTLIALWLKRMKNPKIKYSFEYAWGMNDHHLLIDKNQDKNDISVEDVIKLSPSSDQLLLLQTNEGMIPVIEDARTHIVSKLEQAPQLAEKASELIFVLVSNHTDKHWYTNQYKLAQLYNKPIKIIHLK